MGMTSERARGKERARERVRVNTDFPEFRSVEKAATNEGGDHAIWPYGATAKTVGKRRRQRDFSRAEQLQRTMIDWPGAGCGADGGNGPLLKDIHMNLMQQ